LAGKTLLYHASLSEDNKVARHLPPSIRLVIR
jgi:hypothetical protein